MRCHIVIGSIITLLIIFSCKKTFPSIEGDLIIKNVNVISMTGESDIYENVSVVIKDGLISAIGQYNVHGQAEVVDGRGKFLVPGLTEMHAHIPVATDGNDTLVKETLFLYLSQGITNIRGMLGNSYHLELRQEVEDGDVLGPRIYTSSPSMNGNSIPSKEDAIEKVQQYKNDGYDFLKIHPGIQLDVWNELEKTAKEVGIYYAGHVPVNVGIRRALSAGYGTVDHLDGFVEGLVPESEDVAEDANGFFGFNFTDIVDVKLIPELVEMAIANDVAVVPTQTLFTRWFSPSDPTEMMMEPEMKYMPAQTRFTWRQNKSRILNDTSYTAEKWQRFIEVRNSLLREMDRQGITFLLGSDAPQVMNVPGFSLHHEMNDMAEVGISNYKILHSGTAAPATYFHATNEYGTIVQGASADLILLNKDPLQDISNMSSIESVVVKGKVISKSEIEKTLESIALRNE